MISAKPNAADGPLPLLLHLLTIVTGFVDAVSFLRYGHVFVANMTGNVVFLGFAIAGAPGISIGGSLVALAAFLLGALLGGKLNQRWSSHRGDLFAIATAIKVPLLAGAALLCLFAPSNATAIIAALGMTMGIQNAVARKLAIPDVTTTVLTMTLTGLAADSSIAGGSNPRFARRITAVLTMFAGALFGGWVTLHASVTIALFTAAAIVAVAGIGALLLGRGGDRTGWASS